MRTVRLCVIAGLIVAALPFPVATARATDAQPGWAWYEVDAQRNVRVNLYLFWSSTCPHCPAALEFAAALEQRYPWLNVYRYEVSGNPANRELYQRMAGSLNQPAGPTPALIYCKQVDIGYGSYEQTGWRVERNLVRWYEALRNYYRQHPAPSSAGRARLGLLRVVMPLVQVVEESEPPDLPVELPPEEEVVHVPGWGGVEASRLSLPLLTLVLAGCDAFNPCAFFVLLFLLSLLVHGHSRARMLLVGGTFVFFSGLMYFLFMAAWLNLFFLVGHLRIITQAAGAGARLVARLNQKDFFWFKQGPSLSIPEGARPDLFRRMTGLVRVSSLPAMLAGTAALASVANLYELLCTSGFPLVYTRVLTLRQLPAAGYYSYLVLYNVVYVTPLALIVLAFVLTLGTRKLTEYGGRVLKLLSGTMMLALGILLMFCPEVLNTVAGTVAVLAAALGLTALVVAVDRARQIRHAPAKKEGGSLPNPGSAPEKVAAPPV